MIDRTVHYRDTNNEQEDVFQSAYMITEGH